MGSDKKDKKRKRDSSDSDSDSSRDKKKSSKKDKKKDKKEVRDSTHAEHGTGIIRQQGFRGRHRDRDSSREKAKY